jgi:hypothetical protein
MKRRRLVCAGALAAALAAAGLGAGAPTARAGVVTLDVSGSMSPSRGSATCTATGCKLGGNIVINNSTEAINAADVTVAGESPTVGPFTRNLGIYAFLDLTQLAIGDSANDILDLVFSTPTVSSLVGYTGGSLSSYTFIDTSSMASFTDQWDLTSGSLTEQVAAPAPLIGRGVPVFLAMVGVFFGVKLLERGQMRRPLGTAFAFPRARHFVFRPNALIRG